MAEDLNDIDALAAGYVLGQLDPVEQGEAVRRLAADADFARRVSDWEKRLLPLAEAVPAVAPPPGLWRRIEAATDSARPRSAVTPQAGRPLFAGLRFWQWSTGLSTAAALALLLLVVLQPAPPSSRWVAVLGEGGAQPSWLVTLDLEERSLTVRPVGSDVAAALGPQQTLELWLLAGEAAPRSLGLMDPSGARTLAFPVSAAVLAPGSALAVSVEPEGGSPTGLPTGPVILQGRLLALGES